MNILFLLSRAFSGGVQNLGPSENLVGHPQAELCLLTYVLSEARTHRNERHHV